MKKKIVLALSTLALASALPAAAATTITADGWLRDRGIMANLTKGKDQDPDLLVDQRFRLRFTFSPTEYIKVVYFGEIDLQWGDASYATARNQGGGLGGDTVNFETKNLYAEVKFPNTPLTVTAGLQGLGDNWDGSFIGMDGTALKFNIKSGISTVDVYWSKFYEGNRLNPQTNKTSTDGDDGSNAGLGSSRADDDADLYAANIQLKPTDRFKVGADLYYYRNQGSFAGANLNEWWASKVWVDGSNLTTGTGGGSQFISVEDTSLYYVGLNAAYTLPFLSVSGWGSYNFGTLKLNRWDRTAPTPPATAVTAATRTGEEDVKVRGVAASAKVQTTFAGATIGLRGIYYSAAGTDPGKSSAQLVPWGPGEPLPFAGEGLILMLGDALVCTYGAPPAMAMQDAAWAGFGLVGGVLSTSYVPPADPNFYVKASGGMFRSRSSSVFGNDRKGKILGTEVAARLGYKFMGSVDVSVNAATAWLGDFYDETVSVTPGATKGTAGTYGHGKDDPDRPYIAYLAMNVPF